ncbi:acetate kinase [Ammoniphilus sp. YIM 78166]|uniref:acetate kinase n=1 Tax=Ammoniphilus sp. YIM 78166 TaxID=1644106 RepID=UPI00106FC917|nr:acetate kinase [Ammoniphilus sp. YIM 78166]
MPIVLSVNSGSSSLKYQLIDMPSEHVMAKGVIERIGLGDSIHTYSMNDIKVEVTEDIANHEAAVGHLLKMVQHDKYGAIQSLDEIQAVGHRVVHGGERFSNSVLMTDEVMNQLHACIELAPLHNPANITGIQAFQKLLPSVPHVAVFDTAFHQSMPKKTYLYSLPYEYYEKFGIRKYGFHGTSHRFVTKRAAQIMDRPLEELKLISCHLGNGSSIAAVHGGQSIDTSMGFTPLAGVTMGTRSGDVDSAILPFLMDKLDLSEKEVLDIYNQKSGLLALSGISSDLRDIEEAAQQGNERANLAIDIFVERIRNYIGSYAVQMNGVDAIIFTAGIGENSQWIRSLILEKLDWMGIHFDPQQNGVRGVERELTYATSPVKAFIIPTNEELMIARDTMSISGIEEGMELCLR